MTYLNLTSGAPLPPEPRGVTEIKSAGEDQNANPGAGGDNDNGYQRPVNFNLEEAPAPDEDRGDQMRAASPAKSSRRSLPHEPGLVREIEDQGKRSDIRVPPNGGQAVTDDGR